MSKINVQKIRGFEKVSKYADVDIQKPSRKTEWSAGYDMVAAHDIVVQPLGHILQSILANAQETLSDEVINELNELGKTDPVLAGNRYKDLMTFGLNGIKAIMKANKLQPTLVSTGHKAYMPPNERLELSARSSLPLNSLIIVANAPGLVDADYYNNPDNEGEIFFQIINLSPVPIKINKGDVIGQGVFSSYLVTDDDSQQPKQERKGGFGSTSKK